MELHLIGLTQRCSQSDPLRNPALPGVLFIIKGQYQGADINKGVKQPMLPVFATNRIDLTLLEICSAIWILPELISTFTQKKAQNSQVFDRVSGFILIICIFAGIFLGLNTSFSAGQYAISGDRRLLFYIGLFLILAGAAFRWYSIWVLGKFFTQTISIQAEQTVIENGPYHYIRHPSYSGAMISFFGFGLALTNWLSLGLVILGTVLGYCYRVYVEERVLVKGLGQPYIDYMKHTKRFIPFLF